MREAPDELSEAGKRVWNGLIEDVEELNTLKSVDYDLFLQFCHVRALLSIHAARAEISLEDAGIYLKTQLACRTLARELGLTPTSRGQTVPNGAVGRPDSSGLSEVISRLKPKLPKLVA